MRYRIIVTPAALNHLRAIEEFIGLDSPSNAAAFLRRLDEEVSTLAFMPNRNPLARESRYRSRPIRQLLVPPCRVLYRVIGSTVFVVAVWHGARQDWKPR